MYQLNEENENTEIMVDYESRKTVTLKELLLDFWDNFDSNGLTNPIF